MLLVLGAGYVAVEQAQIFARLGSKVTIPVRSRLASAEEPEASRALMGVFADEGIRVVRRVSVSSVRTDPTTGGVVATAAVSGGQEEFRAARVLVATGHREFVYVAAAHGSLVVENAFNNAGREVDYRHLPRVTFTSPALAAVGMTDKEANEAGIRCECRVLPLEYVPRALVNRDTRGFIKIVADTDTGRLVGITAVDKDAGDLAAAGVCRDDGEPGGNPVEPLPDHG